MDVFDALFTRRSIRKFTTQFVSKDDENLILKAAMLAPSACNEQPWHFVCVRDAEMRERLSHVSPYTHMAAEAPLVIVVCGDLSLEKAKSIYVIAQNAETCVVYGMPMEAYKIGAVCQQAPLGNIPQVVMARLAKQ